MCGKILAIIIVLIAIILAILGTAIPAEHIDYVIGVSKFFDIMLPVLAVGALLKYLLCHSGKVCGTGTCGTGVCGKCGCSNGTCKCCNKEGNPAGTCSISSNP